MTHSLNKKEWICLLFKEWILEKSESEFGVNICVIHSFWSDHRDHSGIHSLKSEHIHSFLHSCRKIKINNKRDRYDIVPLYSTKINFVSFRLWLFSYKVL